MFSDSDYDESLFQGVDDSDTDSDNDDGNVVVVASVVIPVVASVAPGPVAVPVTAWHGRTPWPLTEYGRARLRGELRARSMNGAIATFVNQELWPYLLRRGFKWTILRKIANCLFYTP